MTFLYTFFTLLFGSLAFANITTVAINEISLNSDGVFLDCTLQDGRQLVATDSLVIVGNEILAKDQPQALVSTTAEHLEYEDHGYSVRVSKQFCAREGLQGVWFKNKYTGEEQSILCTTKNICD